MTEFQKSESGGWFYLTTGARGFYSLDPDDGSIGRGSEMTITRFQSAEAREYFIQARWAEEREQKALRELQWLRERVMKLATRKRGIRKALADLVAKVGWGLNG